MDLISVKHLLRPASRAQLPPWQEHDALLAGGTWLFSEPHATAHRLIDLHALGWPSIEVSADGSRVVVVDNSRG